MTIASGRLLKHLDEIGEADNTIVVFTTDNGAEVFTWPDGGNTPFKGHQGDGLRGRLPGAVHRALAGQDRPRLHVENGLFSGLDWFPTLCWPPPATRTITDQLLKGVKLGDRNV